MNKILITLAVLAVMVLAFYEVFCHTGEETYTAVVVSKVYSPATFGSGFGYTATSKGLSPTFVSTSTSEKYVLIVRDDTGFVESKEVTAEVWVNAKEGSEVTLTRIIWK